MFFAAKPHSSGPDAAISTVSASHFRVSTLGPQRRDALGHILVFTAREPSEANWIELFRSALGKVPVEPSVPDNLTESGQRHLVGKGSGITGHVAGRRPRTGGSVEDIVGRDPADSLGETIRER